MKQYVLSHQNARGESVDLTYDLMAVTNHYGSLSFGHYTAYAKNVETGIWYDYNDSSVTRVSSF